MTTQKTKPLILFVDDEQYLLDGFKRHLRRDYNVFTASSGTEGLKILEKDVFPVVVSDMKMPGMNGAEFLKHARAMSPETVRLLLTGQADFKETIAAVNEGNIYRFLHKPCPIPVLVEVLEDAIKQYQLIQDQRILLEETLRGSIKALTDILALANPAAFGRASRCKKLVTRLVKQQEIGESWQIEVATMLSQVSGVALPAEVSHKMYQGLELTNEEQKYVDKLPFLTESLFGDIPRIESVREILYYQHTYFDGRHSPQKEVREAAIPVGARLLKLVLDYDTFLSTTSDAREALEALNQRIGWYDPKLLAGLGRVCCEPEGIKKSIRSKSIRTGMIFAEDVLSESGQLLIARGQEVNSSIEFRVQNWSTMGSIPDPLLMIIPDTVEQSGEGENPLVEFMNQ